MLKLVINPSDYPKHQYDFITSMASHTALVSGFGAGKTYAFLRKCLLEMLINKRADGRSAGWVIYPTLALAKDLFVDGFRELLEQYNIPYDFSALGLKFTTQYGTVQIYSGEKPHRLIGANLTWVGFDEFDTIPHAKALQCYRKALGRLRGCNNPRLFVVTTPEGFKATYQIFVEESKEGMKLIHAKTMDNPYIPLNFIDMLRQQYDAKLLDAYLNGQFVNLTAGTVYYAFDRSVHVRDNLAINYNLPIVIMFDFNVYPMSVLWGQFTNRDNITILGEWVSQSHSNTELACLAVIERLPKNLDVIVYGDASGRYGSANSNLSSYEIIDYIFRPHFKSVTYRVPNANPAVKDRVNCVNNRLSKNSMVISSECARLAIDLEQVVWAANGGDIDKSNIKLTHISDALGYFIAFEFPILLVRNEINTMSIR